MTATWPAFPEVTHIIGKDTIDAYAELSGDYNPLHVDPRYAAAGPFGTVIAHGPIPVQTVFEATMRWLASDRVPPGVMIDVSHRGPVRAGDAVRCSGEPPIDHAGALTVRASCFNQRGEKVLEALIVAPRQLVPKAR